MEFFISNTIVTDLFTVSFLVIFLALVSIPFIAVDYIQILLYIELALLGVNLSFVYGSLILDDMLGQVFVILILSVAAAESAIALSIFIVLYRVRGGVTVL
jgi:NADH:ubiquinone oxidoreductase subunit K